MPPTTCRTRGVLLLLAAATMTLAASVHALPFGDDCYSYSYSIGVFTNCNPPDNTALLESLRTPDHGFNPIIASQPYNVYLPGSGSIGHAALSYFQGTGSFSDVLSTTDRQINAIVNNLQLSLSLVGRRRRSLRQSFLSGVGDGGGRGNEGAKMFEYFAAADPPTVGALEAGVLQFPRSLTLPAGTLTYAAVLAGAACLDLDVRASSGSVRSWLADTESLAAFEAANLTVTPSKEPWVAAGPSACAGAACNASLALDPDTMYIWVLLNDGKEDATLTTQYAAHSVQAKECPGANTSAALQEVGVVSYYTGIPPNAAYMAAVVADTACVRSMWITQAAPASLMWADATFLSGLAQGTTANVDDFRKLQASFVSRNLPRICQPLQPQQPGAGWLCRDVSGVDTRSAGDVYALLFSDLQAAAGLDLGSSSPLGLGKAPTYAQSIFGVLYPSRVPCDAAAPDATPLGYTIAEVALHSTADDCWAIFRAPNTPGVYDLTTWIPQHPGGAAAITALCGTDATDAYLAQHANTPTSIAKQAAFYIAPLRE